MAFRASRTSENATRQATAVRAGAVHEDSGVGGDERDGELQRDERWRPERAQRDRDERVELDRAVRKRNAGCDSVEESREDVERERDAEVRYGCKRDFDWTGYKVHLTECCDDDLPHLITHVETVPATQQDHRALQAIQAAVASKELAPQQHLVDAGYVSTKRTLESRESYAIELIGPVHVVPSWQAHTPAPLTSPSSTSTGTTRS
jgi:hypothetical protein